jgi:hypothetical protein
LANNDGDEHQGVVFMVNLGSAVGATPLGGRTIHTGNGGRQWKALPLWAGASASLLSKKAKIIPSLVPVRPSAQSAHALWNRFQPEQLLHAETLRPTRRPNCSSAIMQSNRWRSRKRTAVVEEIACPNTNDSLAIDPAATRLQARDASFIHCVGPSAAVTARWFRRRDLQDARGAAVEPDERLGSFGALGQFC